MDKLTAGAETGSARGRLVAQLRQWLDDGTFPRGLPLPSERQLCARLGANPQTLHKAVELLIEQGLVEKTGPRTRIVPLRAPASLADTVLILGSALAPDDSGGPGWSSALLKGMHPAIVQAGLNAFHLNPRRLSGQLDDLLREGPAGCLAPADLDRLSGAGSGWVDRLLRARLPCAVYGDDPEYQAVDRVCSDHAQGAWALTRFLLAAGCRRIMRRWPGVEPPRYWQRGRQAGYEQALREAGLAPFAPLLEPWPEAAGGSRAAWDRRVRLETGCLAEHFARFGHPDAIMTPADGCVPLVAAACRRLGLVPGRDLEVVGYDNIWGECPERQYEPYVPPATVDKLNPVCGEELVRLLLARRAGELPPGPQRRLVLPRLLPLR